MKVYIGPILIVFLFFSQLAGAQSNESFGGRVKYYFELGLLGNKDKISLDAVTENIRQKYHEDWGGVGKTDGFLVDMHIIDYGSNKSWWKDTEADVLKGNNVYINTFKQWGAISDGVFLPKNIKENWMSDRGPIEVIFELNNTTHRFVPRYLDDYIDMAMLKKINKLLSKSENKFEMVLPFDQSAFVLWLSRKEKIALLQRGWRFSW